MRRTLGVAVVLLIASLLIPPSASAQVKPGGGAKPRVGQNYPNPFNPQTSIPFVLPDAMFEGGKTVVVSMRILNAAMQLVAIPVSREGKGPVSNLEYTTPGEKLAFWDGLDRNGRKVGSGVYYLVTTVNGERLPPTPMVVAK